jgi:hypothetical protein
MGNRGLEDPFLALEFPSIQWEVPMELEDTFGTNCRPYPAVADELNLC